MYSHNQLYGKWFVRPAGERPETKRQLRFAVHTTDRSALLYSASEIEVLDESGLETQRYLADLGLDVVDRSVSAARVLERSNDDAFSRRQLSNR